MSAVSSLSKLVTGRIGPARESEPSQVKGVLSFIGLSHGFCLLSLQQPYYVRQGKYFQQVSQKQRCRDVK